jgi:hypothetical protein
MSCNWVYDSDYYSWSCQPSGNLYCDSSCNVFPMPDSGSCSSDGYGGCLDYGCSNNSNYRCVNNNGTCQCLVDYYNEGCALSTDGSSCVPYGNNTNNCILAYGMWDGLPYCYTSGNSYY